MRPKPERHKFVEIKVENAEYETTRSVQVEVDGLLREGRFRTMDGNVIVYFEDEIKYAQYGLDRPETVARWLLSDLCRRRDAKKRKGRQ